MATSPIGHELLRIASPGQSRQGAPEDNCIGRFTENRQIVSYVSFEVLTVATMKNVVFCDIKIHILFHRKHITSLLQSLAG
jgi:hypothetical protein